jgi:glycosyltransferase involved in cell wall biosynthesis
MSTQPLVSIVVPCFNGGRFLPGLLACLDAQTWREFETIIVNDGSTELATTAALDEAPSWVQVIHQPNGGLAGARNAGFRKAQGSYVLPLDCDDAIEPEFLARAVASMDGSPREVGFAFCDMRLEGARQGVLRRHFSPFDQLFLNQLPYALLMRRAVWEAVGGYDEAMRDGYEDWEFNLRLIKAGYRGRKIDAPLFVYHVRPDGMLLSQSARKHAELWRYIRAKHPDLYGRSSFMAAYSSADVAEGKVGWPLAHALLAAAMVLPDSVFGRLFQLLLRIRR